MKFVQVAFKGSTSNSYFSTAVEIYSGAVIRGILFNDGIFYCHCAGIISQSTAARFCQILGDSASLDFEASAVVNAAAKKSCGIFSDCAVLQSCRAFIVKCPAQFGGII